MKTLGILGGMGPLATSDFYRKLIDATPAQYDHEHISVAMVADPRIPPRTAAWQDNGPSPLPALIDAARRCVNAGAQVMAMPCNTAHFWFDELAATQPQAVWLHMPREALAAVKDASVLALAATHATVAMGLYQDAARALGMHVRWTLPDDATQAALTQAIAYIKAGDLAAALQSAQPAVQALTHTGCDALILGCTELPLIAAQLQCEAPLVDATEALARAAVHACR